MQIKQNELFDNILCMGINCYKKLKTLQLFDIKAGGIMKAKNLKEK